MKQNLLAVLLVLSVAEFSDQALREWNSQILFVCFQLPVKIIFFKKNVSFKAPSIKPCPRNAEIAECFKNAFEHMKPNLRTGQIAPGFSIQPMQPLDIGDVEVKTSFDLKLFGVKANGVADYKVEKARVNIDKLKVSCFFCFCPMTPISTFEISFLV